MKALKLFPIVCCTDGKDGHGSKFDKKVGQFFQVLIAMPAKFIKLLWLVPSKEVCLISSLTLQEHLVCG